MRIIMPNKKELRRVCTSIALRAMGTVKISNMSVVRHFNARATSTTWYYNPVARTNAIYKDVAAGREAASVSVLGRPRRGTFCKSRRIGATPVFVLQQGKPSTKRLSSPASDCVLAGIGAVLTLVR